jgi:hypothetical protein
LLPAHDDRKDYTMTLLKRFALTLLVLMIPLGTLSAQGAPESIQDALAALNQRLGQSLTLGDVFWTWEQDVYPDASLGCPSPGEMYAQVMTTGYKYTFTYQNISYEYRVSTDRQIVRFCGETEVGEDGPELPTPDEQELSNVLCPPPTDDLVYMKTRLAPGIEAQVLPGLPNNLRDAPLDSGAVIGQIAGGEIFEVVGGPFCDDQGTLWWQVTYNGLSGYTAEGRAGEFYVQPAPPVGLPPVAGLPAITVANLTSVGEVTAAYGSFAGDITFLPDGRLALTGNAGSEGVWLYDLALFSQPRIFNAAERLPLIAATSIEDTVLLGGDEGTIRLWNLGGGLLERTQLRHSTSALTAIAINPDGTTLLSTGGLALTSANSTDDRFAVLLWDVATVSQRVVLRGHTDEVIAAAFSPDGTFIYTASLDGTLRVWRNDTGTLEASITHPQGEPVAINAMAVNPAGTLAALAYADGLVEMVDLTNPRAGNLVRFTVGQPGPVTNALAFSPDGTLLAFGDAGGSLRLLAVAVDAAAANPTNQFFVAMATPELLPIRGVAFSPDGKLVATVGDDNALRLFAVVAPPANG